MTGFKISQTDAVSKVWVTGEGQHGVGLKPTYNKEAVEAVEGIIIWVYLALYRNIAQPVLVHTRLNTV